MVSAVILSYHRCAEGLVTIDKLNRHKPGTASILK